MACKGQGWQQYSIAALTQQSWYGCHNQHQQSVDRMTSQQQ